MPSDDVISVLEWIQDATKTPATRLMRRMVLCNFARANDKLPADQFAFGKQRGRPKAVPLENVVESTERVLDDIKSGVVTIYQTARRFVSWLIEKQMSPNTISQWRSVLPSFFESTLGEENFKHRTWDRIVPSVKAYVKTEKNVPSPDQLRKMMELSTPLYRALLAILACTGARISEILERKFSDLEFREWGGARIKLQPEETKSKTRRSIFWTKEAVQLYNNYRLTLKGTLYENSQWLFAGEKDQHLDYNTALYRIKLLFQLAGCKDKKGEAYSPHSFRTFADNQMVKAGLDRKWIALIIGHKSKLESEERYKSWDEIEKSWVELCEPLLTWNRPVELVKDPELIKKIDDYRFVMNEVLKRMIPGKMSDEERLEQAKTLLLGDHKQLSHGGRE